MKYPSKHLPAALLGRHGYIQQLRAYALLRNDDSLYPSLREAIEKIDRAIDQITPAYAKQVIENVYRNGRTLKETQHDLGRSYHWVELYHAIGCNDFGMAIDIENGMYDLKLNSCGKWEMIPSDHVEEPPDAATMATIKQLTKRAGVDLNDD